VSHRTACWRTDALTCGCRGFGVEATSGPDAPVIVANLTVPNALGIEGFHDLDLSIVEHLLRGKSESETIDALTKEYGSEKAEGFDSKIRRLRQSTVFRQLLS